TSMSEPEQADMAALSMTGTQWLEVSGSSPADQLAPNRATTAVTDLGQAFSITDQGTYQLTWSTPLGACSSEVQVTSGLDYLIRRLEADQAYNEWGIYMYGMDGVLQRGSLAQRVVEYGEAAIPALVGYLDDPTAMLIEGSEDATIGSMYGHRRQDYAAILIAQIAHLDVPDLRAQDPETRDSGIAVVRAWLESRSSDQE
ncbi:MAG: hypothetical protein KC561_16860, partial [Myxococcales bacterium]|nr:hypothetical protein [Myxococcales bacterium]